MSPRHVPASVTELQRIGLFGSLPGETIAKLAARMVREEFAGGERIVGEGESTDRFYVLLSGMAGAALVPALVALIANEYHGKQQATALGALGSARAGAGVLAFLIGGIFWWSVRSGQFDDLEGPAHRILQDEDEDTPEGR